jgi:hypothetical protein
MSIAGLGLRSAAAPMAPTPVAMQAGVAFALPLPMKRGAGILARLFGRPPAEESEVAPVEPVRRLSGRVVRRDGNLLVVEVEVDATDLAWAPPGMAEVTWDDGTARQAAVDAGRSTRAGVVAAGRVLRIALDLAGGPPSSPAKIALLLGEARLVVEVG